jgi:hypothetical protein
MTDDLEPPVDPVPAAELPAPELPAPKPPPAWPPLPLSARDPAWGYSDLFLFVGMALPSMLVGALTVKAAMWALHLHTKLRAVELVPAQFLGYALLFGGLALLLRTQYNRPFWTSMGWRPMGMAAPLIVLAGISAALAVSFTGQLLHMPETANPMMELLSDPVSLAVVGTFGVTLGPLCEELVFRGFLQPLLVRSFGAAAGIAAGAVPFGLLHLQQYGYSWRHALLITGAGVGFGWMRHATGSTRASTLMHAAYNGLFFLALLAQRKDFPHTW